MGDPWRVGGALASFPRGRGGISELFADTFQSQGDGGGVADVGGEGDVRRGVAGDDSVDYVAVSVVFRGQSFLS